MDSQFVEFMFPAEIVGNLMGVIIISSWYDSLPNLQQLILSLRKLDLEEDCIEVDVLLAEFLVTHNQADLVEDIVRIQMHLSKNI